MRAPRAPAARAVVAPTLIVNGLAMTLLLAVPLRTETQAPAHNTRVSPGRARPPHRHRVRGPARSVGKPSGAVLSLPVAVQATDAYLERPDAPSFPGRGRRPAPSMRRTPVSYQRQTQ